MAWTAHGHHISGTVMISEDRPVQIARCGGPGLCTKCSAEAALYKANQKTDPPAEQHTDDTLFKVLTALSASGLTQKQAINAIRVMQNAGILFRERVPG
jgi:hypothetical protein